MTWVFQMSMSGEERATTWMHHTLTSHCLGKRCKDPGAQFTCFTSTKVQNLTPEQHEAVTLADRRSHALGRSDEAAGASNVAL